MPGNRFPDSPEKRALRRRDGRALEQFAKRIGHALDYVGMPSVEYLDVESWRASLRAVTAVEYEREVANDMRIERDRRQFPFSVTVVENEICQFLTTSQSAFDLYNLDFYTGFVNVGRRSSQAASVNAMRTVFANQSRARRSFTLVATFNVRDQGADEYLNFLDAARQELAGRPQADANLTAHGSTQAARLKICFPFFCWQQAHATGFEYEMENVHVYHSVTARSDDPAKIVRHTMVHFHQRFIFRQSGVLSVPALRVLIGIANLPLYEMREQIPHKLLVLPQVTY